jgi:tetratricopeptide (TPR) repeat protein
LLEESRKRVSENVEGA